MKRMLWGSSVAAGIATLALSVSAQSAIEPLHFHHVHLNSVDPKAAAAYYPKPFAQTAVVFAFANIAFSIADLFVGHVDTAAAGG